MPDYYIVHRRDGTLRRKPYEVQEEFECNKNSVVFKGTRSQCDDMAFLLNWARQQREKAE